MSQNAISHDTIGPEAFKITFAAEHAHSAEAREAINKQLHSDMQKYSPSDYNKLLTQIGADNRADVANNAALPTLSFLMTKGSTRPDQIGIKQPTAEEIRDEEAFRKIRKDAGNETPQSCNAVGADLDKFQKEMNPEEYRKLYDRVVSNFITSHCPAPLKAPNGGWNVI